MSVEEVLKVAAGADFTGYAFQDDTVFLFRNGDLSKYYEGGRYVARAAEITDRVGDVSFYSLEYPTLKNLIEITPEEGEITDPRAAVEEIGDKEVDETAKAGQGLEIGGDDVDVKDMFSITEELVEESPKERGDSQALNVGGDEIDVEELMERADDVMEELD